MKNKRNQKMEVEEDEDSFDEKPGRKRGGVKKESKDMQ